MERPEFGERIPGHAYAVRPGAYAVLVDEHERVAVVRTAAGCFLPGGGAEPGESAEAAVVREVREETGYEVDLVQALCEADELIVDHEVGFLIKRGSFFVVQARGAPPGPGEDDHELLWLEPHVADGAMRHGSHAWAVRQVTSAAP